MHRIVPLAVLAFLVLGGCRKPAPVAAIPTTGDKLLTDLQAKFDAIGPPDEVSTYDLRKADDQASLATALKPYNAALDEADTFGQVSRFGGPFLPAADYASDPNSTVQSAAQKQGDARASFCKTLVKALTARARLELVQAKSEAAYRDFAASAHFARLLSASSDSYLGALIAIADQAIIATELRSTAQDTTLTGDQLRRLEKVAAEVGVAARWKAALHAEIAAERNLPYAATVAGKRDIADATRIEALMAKAKSIAAFDQQLRAKVGNAELATTAKGLRNASISLVLATMLEAGFRQTAMDRMSDAELDLLAYGDKNGNFPAALPKTVDAVDPFDPGGGRLAYSKTTSGFTLVAPHSRGALHSQNAPVVVSLEYPPKGYVPVTL